MNKSYLESIQSRSSHEDTDLPEVRDDKADIGTGAMPETGQLPPIDRLEDFNPNGQSMYQRVLMTVRAENQIRSIWLYHYELGHNGQRVGSGQWNQA